MAGASARHNRIALNIGGRLNDHLDGDECEAFVSDMKVRVAPDLFYYPDVVVTCDPPGGDPYFRTHPRLVVEVLSPDCGLIPIGASYLANCQLSSQIQAIKWIRQI